MEELPDKDLFMICKSLNKQALSSLPQGYSIKNCRKDEFYIWKAMHFDDSQTAAEYDQFMEDYFKATFADQKELFFDRTLFVCDDENIPIATCLLWKAYNKFNTIQWFKVVKNYEEQGIGRALLSSIMKGLDKSDYPIFLHTHPSSYRAIKLYSDFGFQLLSDPGFGIRSNDLEDSLAYLKKHMPKKYFDNLEITKAPESIVSFLSTIQTVQF